MNILLGLAAALVGLSDRPAILTGADPVTYGAKLVEAAIQLDANAAGGPACSEATVRSERGMELGPDWPARNRVRPDTMRSTPWREQLAVNGCGRSSLQNVVIVKLDNGWGVMGLFPGESAADYRLQRDAILSAMQAAAFQSPRLSCSVDEQHRTFRLENTKLTSTFTSGSPWTERWTFGVCGEDRSVVMSFTPSADGGTDIGAKAP